MKAEQDPMRLFALRFMDALAYDPSYPEINPKIVQIRQNIFDDICEKGGFDTLQETIDKGLRVARRDGLLNTLPDLLAKVLITDLFYLGYVYHQQPTDMLQGAFSQSLALIVNKYFSGDKTAIKEYINTIWSESKRVLDMKPFKQASLSHGIPSVELSTKEPLTTDPAMERLFSAVHAHVNKDRRPQ